MNVKRGYFTPSSVSPWQGYGVPYHRTQMQQQLHRHIYVRKAQDLTWKEFKAGCNPISCPPELGQINCLLCTVATFYNSEPKPENELSTDTISGKLLWVFIQTYVKIEEKMSLNSIISRTLLLAELIEKRKVWNILIRCVWQLTNPMYCMTMTTISFQMCLLN